MTPGSGSSGADSTGSRRLNRVREVVVLDSAGDHLLVSSHDDIRWLCGFTGSHGWLLLRRDAAVLLTDGRYTEQARLEGGSVGLDLEVLELSSGETLSDLVKRIVSWSDSSPRVSFQPRFLDVSQFRELEKSLGSCLVEVTSDFDCVRRHKDESEIARIDRAARIADGALVEVLPILTTRPTERDVRDELDYRMRRLGADGPSYDTIVATGPVNSAKPHHFPDATVIEEGHSVVIDVGALVEGYHSDMTRTFLVGDVDAKLRSLYDIVREAQAAAVEIVSPGVPCREVDRACRTIFEDFGVADLFVHGTGHGVGLAIHENPYLGGTSTATLEVGDVVTVEPGLYRMGFGGVRIEDLLVVTEDAHRCLTTLPKDPSCPPSPPTT